MIEENTIDLDELFKNVVVLEISEYIKKKFIEAGEWPSREDLNSLADKYAEDIRKATEVYINKLRLKHKNSKEILGFDDDGM